VNHRESLNSAKTDYVRVFWSGYFLSNRPKSVIPITASIKPALAMPLIAWNKRHTLISFHF
jgi:hypothetical protein